MSITITTNQPTLVLSKKLQSVMNWFDIDHKTVTVRTKTKKIKRNY